MSETSESQTHVLGEDYMFLVTDENGTKHNVGGLVNAVLTLRRNERTLDDQAEGTLRIYSGGLVAGMESAINVLFGHVAKEAFLEHYQEVERFLQASNTERH